MGTLYRAHKTKTVAATYGHFKTITYKTIRVIDVPNIQSTDGPAHFMSFLQVWRNSISSSYRN